MTTSTASSAASFSTTPQQRFVSRNSSALSTHSSSASATVARRSSQRRRSHRNSQQTPCAATPPPAMTTPQPADDSVDDDLLSLDLELTDYEKLILTKYLREFEGDADGTVRLGSRGHDDDDAIDPQTPVLPEPERLASRTPTGRAAVEALEAATPALDRFPCAEPQHNDRHSFPCKTRSAQLAAASGACCAAQIATNSPSTFSSPSSSSPSAVAAAASTNNNLGVGGGVNGSGVANNSGNGVASTPRHQPRAAASGSLYSRRSMMRKTFSIWVGVTSCVWGLLLYLDKSYF